MMQPFATRRVGIDHFNGHSHTLCVHEFRICLLVVPSVAVSLPVVAVEVQDLRFDAAAGRHVTTNKFQRQRFSQHGVLREVHRAQKHRAGHGFCFVVKPDR